MRRSVSLVLRQKRTGNILKSEPLIEHVDKNPFGANAQMRKVITDSLTHMIKSIA